MNTISLNLSIPADLYNNLLMFVHKLKSKDSNDFIVEAINQKLMSEKEQLQHLLVEGYNATKEEDFELTKEFETIDLMSYDN